MIMFGFQITADLKKKIEKDIFDYMDKNSFDYSCSFLEKELGITSDMLFYSGKKIPVAFNEDTVIEKTDYIMIITKNKFDGHYMEYFIYFFNDDEIAKMCELEKSFSEDEIKYMEIEDDYYNDLEMA